MESFRSDNSLSLPIRLLFMLLFLFIVFFQQFSYYSFSFYTILCLFLIVPFFKEKHRLFIWSLLAFSIAEFLTLYFIRFVDFLDYSLAMKVLLSQLLYSLHLFFIVIILFSFKQKPPISFHFQRGLQIAFLHKKISVLSFILFIVLSLLFGFSSFIVKGISSLSFSFLLYSLLFALIYAIIQEGLWRGLLLPIFTNTIGNIPSILAIGISSGLLTTSLGLIDITIPLFCLWGILLTYITISTKNIIYSIILQFTLSLLLSLSGIIFIGF